MRFIKKIESPECFEEEKKLRGFGVNTAWKRFGNPCKKILTEHLKNEQNHLCVYCECNLQGVDSHIEHLAPQEIYSHLRFDYDNITVSCAGFDCESGKEKQSCGHRKNNEYDECLFINPIAEENIASYFSFIKDGDDEGNILPAKMNVEKIAKAEYMIRILRLDADYLREQRKAAKKSFIDFSISYPDIDLRSELETEREFISFLRYCFAPFLVESP